MRFSLPASPRFYRLLNAVLMLLACWYAAKLFWLVFALRPALPVAAPATRAAGAAITDTSALANLFGGQPSAVAASSLDVKLRGVIAAQGQQAAAAIFEQVGRPALAVKTGEEVAPGARLVEVAADHVLVEHAGRRERIELDAKPAAAGVQPVQVTPAPQSPMAGQAELGPLLAAPISKPAAALNEERPVSRQALAQGMQGVNMNEWSRGLSPSGDGIALENAGAQPLATPLGLQSGDVLRRVNGNALRKPADIAVLYSAFTNTNNVTLELQRNGAPLLLHYRVDAH